MRVAVCGACGRMGRGIVSTITREEDIELVCAIESPKCEHVGKDVGKVAGLGKVGIEVKSSYDIENVLRKCKPEVLVDFTNAEAALKNVKAAAKSKVNVVVGTTGFTGEQRAEMEGAIKGAGIAAVISPNMATGVNVFFRLAYETTKLLGDEYDVEVIETHHRHKKDAPSGTAMKVGELVCKALGRDLEEAGVFGRGRGLIGERKPAEIGFHAIRGGDIVGEHTVLFASEGERVEMTHRASTRQCFVNGAIRAMRFVHEEGKPGEVYSSWDVLGIAPL